MIFWLCTHLKRFFLYKKIPFDKRKESIILVYLHFFNLIKLLILYWETIQILFHARKFSFIINYLKTLITKFV